MQTKFPVYLTYKYSQIFLLLITVILLYGHTRDVPFYLDDFSSIEENPVIYNWQGTLKEIVDYARLRTVGYLTFVANYQVHQFQVGGYHNVNILIHLLAGIAIWGLTRGLIRTPILAVYLPIQVKSWFPLLVSLLFLIHPLQTQAVTYIIQRLASLAALFYLTTMLCFVYARLTENSIHRILWTSGCLLALVLAFLTKENTFTLPYALLLLEWVFFQLSKRKLLIITSIVVISSILMSWLAAAWILNKNPFAFKELSETAQLFISKSSTVNLKTYSLTQLNVLWTYLHLFFVPVGLHIDYDYPLNTQWTFRPELAFSGHFFLLGGTLYGLRLWLLLKENLSTALKSKNLALKPENLYFLPFVTTGILFYYLAHAVESSIIPINDVIFEHRTYLPNFGLCLAIGGIIVQLVCSLNEDLTKFVWLGILVLFLGLGITTRQRNQLWRDPIALWSQNVQHAPHKQRAWIILGKHYILADEAEKGLAALEKTVIKRRNPDGSFSVTMTTETLLNMVAALRKLKRYDEALERIDQALRTPLRAFDKAKFLVNQGNIFFEKQLLTEAEIAYRQAIAVYPQNLTAQLNLANLLTTIGHLGEAEILYKTILAIEPSNVDAQRNLAKIFEYKKSLQ